MSKIFYVTLVVFCVSSLMVSGCGQKETLAVKPAADEVMVTKSNISTKQIEKNPETSRSAIDIAKSMSSKLQQTSYLINQAKTFYNSKQFQDTVDIAQYILRYLDKDSTAAKNLLTMAKEQLTTKASGMLDEAKKSIVDFGK